MMIVVTVPMYVELLEEMDECQEGSSAALRRAADSLF